MKDYPFNRVILDLVELLQDLKQQGYKYIVCMNSVGSVDIHFFVSEQNYEEWMAGDYSVAHTFWIMADDTEHAMKVFNDLMMFKEPSAFDFLETSESDK